MLIMDVLKIQAIKITVYLVFLKKTNGNGTLRVNEASSSSVWKSITNLKKWASIIKTSNKNKNLENKSKHIIFKIPPSTTKFPAITSHPEESLKPNEEKKIKITNIKTVNENIETSDKKRVRIVSEEIIQYEKPTKNDEIKKKISKVKDQDFNMQYKKNKETFQWYQNLSVHHFYEEENGPMNNGKSKFTQEKPLKDLKDEKSKIIILLLGKIRKLENQIIDLKFMNVKNKTRHKDNNRKTINKTKLSTINEVRTECYDNFYPIKEKNNIIHVTPVIKTDKSMPFKAHKPKKEIKTDKKEKLQITSFPFLNKQAMKQDHNILIKSVFNEQKTMSLLLSRIKLLEMQLNFFNKPYRNICNTQNLLHNDQNITPVKECRPSKKIKHKKLLNISVVSEKYEQNDPKKLLFEQCFPALHKKNDKSQNEVCTKKFEYNATALNENLKKNYKQNKRNKMQKKSKKIKKEKTAHTSENYFSSLTANKITKDVQLRNDSMMNMNNNFIAKHNDQLTGKIKYLPITKNDPEKIIVTAENDTNYKFLSNNVQDDIGLLTQVEMCYKSQPNNQETGKIKHVEFLGVVKDENSLTEENNSRKSQSEENHSYENNSQVDQNEISKIDSIKWNEDRTIESELYEEMINTAKYLSGLKSKQKFDDFIQEEENNVSKCEDEYKISCGNDKNLAKQNETTEDDEIENTITNNIIPTKINKPLENGSSNNKIFSNNTTNDENEQNYNSCEDNYNNNNNINDVFHDSKSTESQQYNLFLQKNYLTWKERKEIEERIQQNQQIICEKLMQRYECYINKCSRPIFNKPYNSLLQIERTIHDSSTSNETKLGSEVQYGGGILQLRNELSTPFDTKLKGNSYSFLQHYKYSNNMEFTKFISPEPTPNNKNSSDKNNNRSIFKKNNRMAKSEILKPSRQQSSLFALSKGEQILNQSLKWKSLSDIHSLSKCFLNKLQLFENNYDINNKLEKKVEIVKSTQCNGLIKTNSYDNCNSDIFNVIQLTPPNTEISTDNVSNVYVVILNDDKRNLYQKINEAKIKEIIFNLRSSIDDFIEKDSKESQSTTRGSNINFRSKVSFKESLEENIDERLLSIKKTSNSKHKKNDSEIIKKINEKDSIESQIRETKSNSIHFKDRGNFKIKPLKSFSIKNKQPNESENYKSDSEMLINQTPIKKVKNRSYSGMYMAKSDYISVNQSPNELRTEAVNKKINFMHVKALQTMHSEITTCQCVLTGSNVCFPTYNVDYNLSNSSFSDTNIGLSPTDLTKHQINQHKRNNVLLKLQEEIELLRKEVTELKNMRTESSSHPEDLWSNNNEQKINFCNCCKMCNIKFTPQNNLTSLAQTQQNKNVEKKVSHGNDTCKHDNINNFNRADNKEIIKQTEAANAFKKLVESSLVLSGIIGETKDNESKLTNKNAMTEYPRKQYSPTAEFENKSPEEINKDITNILNIFKNSGLQKANGSAISKKSSTESFFYSSGSDYGDNCSTKIANWRISDKGTQTSSSSSKSDKDNTYLQNCTRKRPRNHRTKSVTFGTNCDINNNDTNNDTNNERIPLEAVRKNHKIRVKEKRS